MLYANVHVDLISVMACSALLLNVLSEQDITAGEREAVPVKFTVGSTYLLT